MTATKPLYKPVLNDGLTLMRRAFAAAALVVLTLAVPALAQPGSSEHGRGPPAPVGDFEVDAAARSADGDIVSFTYTPLTVDRFAVGDVVLYSARVDPAASDDGREPRVTARGPEIRVRTTHYTFTAHDNPAGVSRLQAPGGIAITFAEGAILVQGDEGRISFELGDLTGSLRGEELRVAGTTVTASRNVLVFLDKQRGDFDVHREHIGNAIARGHVGAEATFNLADQALQQDVVSYGNVTMTTVKAEQGNLTVLIEGHGFEGRVVVLNVDGRILGAAQANDLSIFMDNASIGRATDLTDILNPDDDGYQPEYYIVHDPLMDPNAFQLIVTVPHYSVHTLSVTTAFVLPPPSVVLGILAGVALLVPSAMLLFRRK